MTPGNRGDEEAENLLKQGIALEWITLGWNVVGTAVVLTAAWSARSVGLSGFGLDSLLEIGASAVVLWELNGTGQGREKAALRLIGVAFFTLAIYLLIQGGYTLTQHVHPLPSMLGIAWLIATFLAMVLLSIKKAQVGKRLGNVVLQTESKVTMVDAILAAAVLVGIVINAAFGLWWADPLSGFVVVIYSIKEGVHTLGGSNK